MKKFLLSVMTLCMWVTANIQAETTDISLYDNVIYIEPVSVHAGAQHTLSIKMKNSVSAEGFEFYLYLPDGISFNGDPSLSTVRTTTAKTNTFNFTIQGDGALHVFAASTVDDAIINGNDGEVALVPIAVDDAMSQGDYSLILKKVAIAGSDAQSYGPDESVEIKTTITITEPLANTILDETSTTAPSSSSEPVNVTVNRTIKANTWSTICLPFDMSATQVKAAFGEDVTLAEFDSWSFTGTAPNVDAIQLNFEKASTITANKPCLIKVSSAVSSFEANNVVITVEDFPECVCTYSVGSGKNKKNYDCGMYGTYKSGTLDEGDVLLSDNTFYVSKGTATIKGYRATFYFDENITLPTDNDAARVVMMVDEGNEMTKINDVDAVVITNSDGIYSISGQYMGKDVKQVHLPKGVYVINGKKKVVK